MTEAEWLACVDDSIAMLRHVCFPEHERKLGLLLCSCWKLVWDLLSPSDQERIAAAARRADTVTDHGAPYKPWQRTLDEMDLEMSEQVWDFNTQHFTTKWTKDTARLAAVLLPGCQTLNFWDRGPLESEAERAAQKCKDSGADVAKAWADIRVRQCNLFREVFGNPFHPSTIAPALKAWNDGTVLKLARAIHDEEAFGHLPILGDALEDAGCTNAEILKHCRGPGPHIPGCWVVDLLLGKE